MRRLAVVLVHGRQRATIDQRRWRHTFTSHFRELAVCSDVLWTAVFFVLRVVLQELASGDVDRERARFL